MAASAAAKGIISISRARAATAARTVLPRFHSTGGEGTLLFESEGKIVHADQKCSLETALFDHKLEMKQLVHEQNVKIIKLQNEVDIFKLELEGMKHEMKHQVIKGQLAMLNSAMAVLGVGILAILMFK